MQEILRELTIGSEFNDNQMNWCQTWSSSSIFRSSKSISWEIIFEFAVRYPGRQKKKVLKIYFVPSDFCYHILFIVKQLQLALLALCNLIDLHFMVWFSCELGKFSHSFQLERNVQLCMQDYLKFWVVAQIFFCALILFHC